MKKNDILFLLISGFFFVVVWIGLSIYRNTKSTTISEATNIQIAPIAPMFDIETIEDIKKRKNIQAIFEEKTTPTPTPTRSASQAIPPTITLSPSISEQQNQATPTGIQQQ